MQQLVSRASQPTEEGRQTQLELKNSLDGSSKTKRDRKTTNYKRNRTLNTPIKPRPVPSVKRLGRPRKNDKNMKRRTTTSKSQLLEEGNDGGDEKWTSKLLDIRKPRCAVKNMGKKRSSSPPFLVNSDIEEVGALEDSDGSFTVSSLDSYDSDNQYSENYDFKGQDLDTQEVASLNDSESNDSYSHNTGSYTSNTPTSGRHTSGTPTSSSHTSGTPTSGRHTSSTPTSGSHTSGGHNTSSHTSGSHTSGSHNSSSQTLADNASDIHNSDSIDSLDK
ncbi:MAG: hypothetical protein Q9169_003811 [Polycauliona sp. 2 TL-2023]